MTFNRYLWAICLISETKKVKIVLRSLDSLAESWIFLSLHIIIIEVPSAIRLNVWVLSIEIKTIRRIIRLRKALFLFWFGTSHIIYELFLFEDFPQISL